MKLIYADCETTGLDPKVHEVVQFAFIIEVNKKVVHEANFKLRPMKPDTISEEALKVTGKTVADLMAYPERHIQFARILEDLGRFVSKYDRNDKLHWVGQNAPFDMAFMRALFESQGDKYFGSWFDNRPADLVSLAKVAWMRGHIKPVNFKLGTLCEVMGVKLEQAHDALADIRATREVFHAMMAAFVLPVGAKPGAPASAAPAEAAR